MTGGYLDMRQSDRRRSAAKSSRNGMVGALYPSQQHEDEKDNDHDAEPAGGIVAPTAAVGPSREGADKDQNQDNEQNGSKRHNRLHFEKSAYLERASPQIFSSL